MINILQITESLDCGGRETFTAVLLKNINQQLFHFDYFTIKTNKEFYTDYVEERGCNIFSSNTQYVGSGIINFLKKNSYICKIVRKHKFDIIHIHADSKLDYIKVILIHFISRVPIIYHAHGSAPLTSPTKKLVANIAEKMASSIPEINLACSTTAAENMFTKKVKYSIIRNPIDIDSYLYNTKTREEIRKKYAIDSDALLIGHVGRFSYEKNHVFIIKCFIEILKVNPNSYLLFVGDGPLKEKIEDCCKSNDIDNRVIFAGTSNCVNEFYSAMDVLWFPSKKESLGMVAVEAQLSGTPVIISTGVPREVIINENVYQLQYDPYLWSKKTLELTRMNSIDEKKFCQYDAEKISNEISNIYKEISTR